MVWELGVPYQRIAEQEGCSWHSIYGIVKRYEAQQSGRNLPRLGRPPILSHHHKRYIF
ncbi:hypothetical protein LZ32DRAFT_211042 [Colletotrichum eremochloae]|nr:hypothetical protein LZ32DRAFT_211042 [Colletotrichum eremochloae]